MARLVLGLRIGTPDQVRKLVIHTGYFEVRFPLEVLPQVMNAVCCVCTGRTGRADLGVAIVAEWVYRYDVGGRAGARLGKTAFLTRCAHEQSAVAHG